MAVGGDAVGYLGHLLLEEALAGVAARQLHSGEDGDGFGVAYPFVALHLLYRHLAEAAQLVVAIGEHLLRELHDRHLGGAAAHKDAEQLGRGHTVGAAKQQLLARAVVDVEVFDFHRFGVTCRGASLSPAARRARGRAVSSTRRPG